MIVFLHSVDAFTYDVGTVICDGDYSCYGSYLTGVREAVECIGEKACSEIVEENSGTYFVISPFNRDGNGFFNGDDFSDGITVTCDRKDGADKSACGYYFDGQYDPDTLSTRTQIDVGIEGTLKCQSETPGDFACEYISFGGLNEAKNAQCNQIEGADYARRIFIRPDDFEPNGEQVFPKNSTAVEVCVDGIPQ